MGPCAPLQYGSSVDPRIQKPKDETGSTGLVLAQKPYLLKHANKYWTETQAAVDILSMYRNEAKKYVDSEWNDELGLSEPKKRKQN